MKLETDMYVRTKYGIAKYIKNYITKATIYRVIDKKIVYDNVEDWEDCLLDNEIIKASYNIIDLIEVGDYVNGCRVIAVNIPEIVGHYSYVKCINDNVFKENEIQSIVTKEMYSSVEYRVEAD